MTDIKSLVVTPQTSLEDVQNFLGQAKDGEKVFGTKSAAVGPNHESLETKTLYLAKNANFKTVGRHDQAHAHDQSRHRVTGRQLIEGVLKNTVRQSEAIRDVDAAHADYKTDVNTLLKNAIDRHVWGGKTSANRFSQGDAPTAAKLLDLTNLVKTTTDRTAWISENYKTPAPKEKLPGTTSRVVQMRHAELQDPDSPKTVALPTFEIGEKIFEPEKILGSGSFAMAVRYKQVDGDAVKIIKVPHEFDKPKIDPNKLTEHVEEVTHERVAGGKYAAPESHIMAYTDHATMPNGTVALIGDAGGIGDVFDFAQTMNNSNLSPHARRLVTLTMAKDMGESLTALHDAGGLHNDMKPENQVVGRDGVANLIDFGFAEPGPTLPLTKGARYTGNNDYNAPEAQLHNKNFESEVEAVGARKGARVDTVVSELNDLLKASGREDELNAFVNAHGDTLDNAIENEAHNMFAMDGKADVYGIGVSTFMLATGGWVSDARHERARQDLTGPTKTTIPSKDDVKAQRLYKKSELARLENSHGISYQPKADARPFDNEALVDATGDPVLDLLLDDLLAPNPNRRTAERNIADHPTMTYGAKAGTQAVGSEAVRKLIVAIAKGDKTEIIKAEAELLIAFPEPSQEEMDFFAKTLAARGMDFTPSATRPDAPPVVAAKPKVDTVVDATDTGVSATFLAEMQLLQQEADEASVSGETTTDAPQQMNSFLQDTARMRSEPPAQDPDDEQGISTSPMI